MFGSTKNLGGRNRTRRVSHYLADLVPTTEVCPVTYTENLSNVWTTADYPLRRLVSHVRHKGVPPFSQGNGGPYRMHESVHTVCLANS